MEIICRHYSDAYCIVLAYKKQVDVTRLFAFSGFKLYNRHIRKLCVIVMKVQSNTGRSGLTPSHASAHICSLVFSDSRHDAWSYFLSRFGEDFCVQVGKEMSRSKKGVSYLAEIKDRTFHITNKSRHAGYPAD